MKALRNVAVVLTVVGALNWGLVALLDFNLVTKVLGEGTLFTNVVYVVVALAGLYVAYDVFVAKEEK